MKQVLLLLAFCLAGSLGYAQSNLSIMGVTPVLEIDTLTGLIQPVDLNTQPFNLTTHIQLSDNSNVQNIHIRAGREVDASDFINITIPYNYTSLPTGIVDIQKVGNNFSIDFGTHTNIYTLHFEVWAEDADGNSTQVFNKRLN